MDVETTSIFQILMKTEVLTPVMMTITGAITFFMTHISEKKKRNTEIQKWEIEIGKQKSEIVSIEFENVKKLLESHTAQIKTYHSQLDDLRERLNTAILENRQERENFMEREVGYLQKLKLSDERIDSLENKITELFTKVCVVKTCKKRQLIDSKET